MQKIKDFFSNTFTLILLLVLGLGVILFLSNQTRQPITQQAPQTITVTVSPADTPALTRTPTVIPVVVTIFPTPTPAPSPTPTPTFEPLSDKPIMGFVFKSPQEVPNTRNSVGYWEIVEWLPDSSEEVLVKGPLTLETINVISGTLNTYATISEPGNIRNPVWLPEDQSVAYLARDFQANKTNLLLGKVGSKSELLLSNVEPPVIPIDNKRSVAVYSKNDGSMKGVSPTRQESIVVPAALNSLPRSERSGFEAIPHTTTQPNGDWIAHYNIDGLRLINSKSEERRDINLGGDEFNPLWAIDAKWSPDGRKLALIVTEGGFPTSFSDLYILEWPAGTLRKVEDGFAYVTDVAWAPDSQHLLLKPIINEQDGFAVTALYLTDISMPSEFVPIPIPVEGLTATSASLSWSPDGQTILVEYFDGQETAIYKINVIAR